MKIITKNDFENSVNKMIKEDPRTVIGVKAKGAKFVFDNLDSANELRLDYDVTILPPKKYFLLQNETLMKYDLTKGFDFEEVNKVDSKIIIGVHPYDIAAIQQMDKIFKEKNEDQNYIRKREESIIIGVNIVNVSPYSFAGSMNTAIVDNGYDLMLFDIGEMYAVEIGTEKGKELLNKYAKTSDAGDEIKTKVDEIKRSMNSKFEKWLDFSPEELPVMLKKNIDDEVTFQKELSSPTSMLRGMLRRSIKNEMFWEEHSKKCLSCGSCITTCPTCYCFDVSDNPDLSLKKGEKVRTWDGCMLQDFAKVASGENFRPSKSSRYRHRYLKKGLYLYERFGFIACVGCGRCASNCLPDIADPTKVLNDWKEAIY